MNGSDRTWASQAEHVRQAPADDAKRLAEAPEPGGIRHRNEGAGEVIDLDEVGVHGSDSLEVSPRSSGWRAAWSRSRRQRGHRVQQAADHIGAGQLVPGAAQRRQQRSVVGVRGMRW